MTHKLVNDTQTMFFEVNSESFVVVSIFDGATKCFETRADAKLAREWYAEKRAQGWQQAA